MSIGVPEKAAALIAHLELHTYHTQDLLYVDPDNALYDALDLNRGIQRTFFNPATPLAFLERIRTGGGNGGGGGLQELGDVLSKWSKGAHVQFKSLHLSSICRLSYTPRFAFCWSHDSSMLVVL